MRLDLHGPKCGASMTEPARQDVIAQLADSPVGGHLWSLRMGVYQGPATRPTSGYPGLTGNRQTDDYAFEF